MSTVERIEFDSIGSKVIPEGVYYGVQSLRAKENFPITGQKMHPEIINSLAMIKKACAIANGKAGVLKEDQVKAIIQACDEILAGKMHDDFIVDAIQGGAGTSANMNANEVIANRASEILGGKLGEYKPVHPNDHVNNGQSTNDVYPTAGKLAIITETDKLLVQVDELIEVLSQKAVEFDNVIKMGRTQMQDAVPIRLGQEFHAYATAVTRCRNRLAEAVKEMHVLNMGATAIGTAVNANGDYLVSVVPELSKVFGQELYQAEDLVDGTQSLDCYPAVSGALKSLAVALSKMSNDLRLMSSGPRTGFGEINLPPKQNGSSIMPGKVNPVIPEVMSQACYFAFGADTTVTVSAEAGQLELNAFEPVIFFSLLLALDAMAGGVRTMIDNCVSGITANADRCKELLDASVGTVTALCPFIGYAKAASIAKYSLKTGEKVRDLVLKEGLLDEATLDKVLDPVAMTTPAKPSK